MGEMIAVAKTGDLQPGKSMCVEVGGQKVALFNIDGSYHAIGDACTHVGAALSEGELDGNVVSCPLQNFTDEPAHGRLIIDDQDSGANG